MGIGNADIYSTCLILTEVCIDNNMVELLFHVVFDDVINYDVMIGRDLITLGFTVEISNDRLSIKKSKIVNLREIGKPICNFEKNKK